MTYLTRNQHGTFCSACGEGPLSIEEDDRETCDACGGEGLGGDDDNGEVDHTPPTTCIETIGGDPGTALRLSFQIKVF